MCGTSGFLRSSERTTGGRRWRAAAAAGIAAGYGSDMASTRIRGWVNRVASRVAQQTAGGTWRVEMSGRGVRHTRIRRVRFTSTDMLLKQLEALNVANQGNPMWVTWSATNTTFPIEDSSSAVRAFAHASPPDRCDLSIEGQWPHPDNAGIGTTWRVTLTTARGSSPLVFVDGSDPAARDFADKLETEVDRFTVPLARRAAAVPLVEPISMETAVQQTHDSAVARRASKIAGAWGAVAGAAGAIVVEVVKALLK
jgi:hypothetical protein